MFQPFMTIVRNGHAVEVINMDPVMHDIQGYETSIEAGARVLFNTPLVMNHQHNAAISMRFITMHRANLSSARSI